MGKVQGHQRVDLNALSRVIADATDYTTVEVQYAPTTPASTVVVTIKKSNDGLRWVALSTPTTIAAAGGMTGPLAIDAAYVCAEVTTKEGAAAYGDITFCLKGNA